MDEDPKLVSASERQVISVLVVDDQEHFVAGLTGMLIPYGLAAKPFRSSEPMQIAQAIMTMAPNVVILDYDLGINHPRGGEDVLEELIALGYNEPTVVITHSEVAIPSLEMAFKRFESAFSIHHCGKFFVDTPGGILECIHEHFPK